MPEILTPTRFGDPVLREQARKLTLDEIKSSDIRTLIENMTHTLEHEDCGVGIAAPQVGQSIALSVIGIKPTPNRPNLEPFNSVIINPEIIETIGDPLPKWEACISGGAGDNLMYAQVPRYESVRMRWLNEQGESVEKVLGGFVAHVAQHEVDHLNGVLFVDRVEDTSTYMMADEYANRIIGRA